MDDLAVALAQRSARDLMLPHLAEAAIRTVEASQGKTCIAERAGRLRDSLLEAHGRAACHWAGRHYLWGREQSARFASAMLRWAAGAERSVIVEVAERVKTSPEALADHLEGLISATTYETDLVAVAVAAWPPLMKVGLALLRGAQPRGRIRSRERLLASLMPCPRVFGDEEGFEATLAQARARWFPLSAVSDHMEEWLEMACGERVCVDALVGYLETLPVHEQVDCGLEWVRRLVVGEDGIALTQGFLLVRWLDGLRKSPALSSRSIPVYRMIVDSLTLRDSMRARDLQVSDE